MPRQRRDRSPMPVAAEQSSTSAATSATSGVAASRRKSSRSVASTATTVSSINNAPHSSSSRSKKNRSGADSSHLLDGGFAVDAFGAIVDDEQRVAMQPMILSLDPQKALVPPRRGQNATGAGVFATARRDNNINASGSIFDEDENEAFYVINGMRFRGPIVRQRETDGALLLQLAVDELFGPYVLLLDKVANVIVAPEPQTGLVTVVAGREYTTCRLDICTNAFELETDDLPTSHASKVGAASTKRAVATPTPAQPPQRFEELLLAQMLLSEKR